MAWTLETRCHQRRVPDWVVLEANLDLQRHETRDASRNRSSGLMAPLVGDSDIEDSCEPSILQIIADSAEQSGTIFGEWVASKVEFSRKNLKCTTNCIWRSCLICISLLRWSSLISLSMDTGLLLTQVVWINPWYAVVLLSPPYFSSSGHQRFATFLWLPRAQFETRLWGSPRSIPGRREAVQKGKVWPWPTKSGSGGNYLAEPRRELLQRANLTLWPTDPEHRMLLWIETGLPSHTPSDVAM